MTRHKLDRITGATMAGTNVHAAGHGEFDPNGNVSPEAFEAYSRQARVVERDLAKHGLTIPPSGKLSITALDRALDGMPVRQRMEFKGRLRQFNLIEK
jgi:hypothetical protein